MSIVLEDEKKIHLLKFCMMSTPCFFVINGVIMLYLVVSFIFHALK